MNFITALYARSSALLALCTVGLCVLAAVRSGHGSKNLVQWIATLVSRLGQVSGHSSFHELGSISSSSSLCSGVGKQRKQSIGQQTTEHQLSGAAQGAGRNSGGGTSRYTTTLACSKPAATLPAELRSLYIYAKLARRRPLPPA
jgi:hypothetical protein